MHKFKIGDIVTIEKKFNYKHLYMCFPNLDNYRGKKLIISECNAFSNGNVYQVSISSWWFLESSLTFWLERNKKPDIAIEFYMEESHAQI